MGNKMSFLLNGIEARGRFAILDASGGTGTEPPPHVYEFEDEIYYLLEGQAEFWIEDVSESIVAVAGDVVFLPQGEAHAIAFLTTPFRTLIMVQATTAHDVTLDTYFFSVSEPSFNMELLNNQGTYALTDTASAFEIASREGLHFLTSEEAIRRLPRYPGFKKRG